MPVILLTTTTTVAKRLRRRSLAHIADAQAMQVSNI
jgi:hypothetical protein